MNPDIFSATAISPIDGRYYEKTKSLQSFFSEMGLMKYRVHVEIAYFIFLCEIPLPQLKSVNERSLLSLSEIPDNFSLNDYLRIKEIEQTTNHDIKAVEYFLKEKFDQLGLAPYKEFIHFGLTSQDINNTSIPLSLKNGMENVLNPQIKKIIQKLEELAEMWKDVPMLARTHGQPASPTRLGKEIEVFRYRMEEQFQSLKKLPFPGKFGGATGNFNAHHVAYPDMNWKMLATKFLKEKLSLKREEYTTQISNYDGLSAIFDNLKRINTIMIDMSRDFWMYISMDYFKQQIKEGEVGSSAMPHKVNPIDFENAEGNLGLANAILEHLSAKIPVSRLQRDLTDSTVLRNIGTPIGHMLISLAALEKGLGKLKLNDERIEQDLENNWAVVAEAIQTILRREGYPNPYEALKALTRTNEKITKQTLGRFIDSLDVSEEVKNELKLISPENYTGI